MQKQKQQKQGGGERDVIPLFQRGHCVSTRDDRGEDVTLHSNTKGKRNDIKKEEILSLGGSGLARKDTGLDRSAVGNSLIRIDALFLVNNSALGRG